MKTVPYAYVVGSLMYAMICIRHDLAHAISMVSIFMANPVKEHWQELKWMLRYIIGSIALATEVAKESLWLKGLVNELGFEQRTILVHYDNQPEYHSFDKESSVP
ncbi:hypothetical protein CR513_10087, partial [Mucuna pruriens]